VHHPAGDLQKVSLGTTTGYATCSRAAGSETFSCTYTTDSSSATTHVRVGWNSGVTEGGSSGSGLFITSGSSKYLVGQLSGGASTCSNPTSNDVYGRFDVPYTAAIYQWLDNSAPRSPVYRFYNPVKRVHFYTSSTAERDGLINNAGIYGFNYEGISFYAYNSTASSLSPVYRFYNTVSGGHFYTISSSDASYINSFMSPPFTAEGIAWYSQTASDGSSSAVYRFYNPTTNAHFYTISANDRDYLINNRSVYGFGYEGIAFYAWTTQ